MNPGVVVFATGGFVVEFVPLAGGGGRTVPLVEFVPLVELAPLTGPLAGGSGVAPLVEFVLLVPFPAFGSGGSGMGGGGALPLVEFEPFP